MEEPSAISISTPGSRYIPALDGLRAVSITMVIYGHLSEGFFSKSIRASTLGPAGVIIFFVISGYLITSQLISESDQTGKVKFGAFLIRRLLRLGPALFAMLLVTLILNHLRWVTVSRQDFIHALTYTMDYYHPKFQVLEHLWSLSVEEQFYLLWPLLFLPFFKLSRTAVALGVILATPCIRFLEWHFGIAGEFRHFECVADCLAAGCLLALIKPQPKFASHSAAIGIGLLVCCCFLNKITPAAQILTISVET